MSKAAELAKSGETLTNQPSGRKNIVTNGAMQVAQRSTSTTGIGASAGYFTLDRYKIETASSAGRLTMTQTADGPSGFANCLKLDCTTADTSIHADEYLFLRQKFEGQDLQQLKKGTSDAESVTVSFYVKGDQAATYVCELKDNDNSRNNTQAFAVTTSWNRIELTFAADTTGALDDDNASSFEINIWLHAGSGYTGGTFASNTWASVTNANRYAGSRTSFYDSTDREFFLTGVQMEIGSQATNFEHRSFGEELALCYRYTQRHPSSDSGENFNVIAQGMASNATDTFHPCRHYVTMRAEPSLTNSGNFRVRYAATAVGTSAATTLYDDGSNSDISFLLGTVGSGLTAGQSIILEQNNDVDAHIILDAEL